MTAFTLKLIAVVCMLIDHTGHVFAAPVWYRYIGRAAFPIFAFLVAEGCLHTKNIYKYLLRLGIFALISQIPFAYMVNGGNISFIRGTNVFYTLFFGVACAAVYEKVKDKLGDKVIAFMAALPIILFGEVLSTDYGMFGVGLVYALYLARKWNGKYAAAAVLAAGMVYLYGIKYNFNYYFLLFSLIAVTAVLVYNGKRGLDNRVVKWGFYAFYPLHITLLVIISKGFLR
jgi:hypothetical protein